MLSVNISDVTIITNKNVGYRFIIHNISKSDAINFLENSVLENLEMLKFVRDHLKTKKMYKPTVKKSPYLLRYVPDQCKIQQMCDKAVLENGGTLKSVQKSRNV